MKHRWYLIPFVALGLNGATETLRYNVNWASGLSLGEATLATDNVDASASSRRFQLNLEASIPGFAVVDEIVSLAKPDYCSIQLDTKLKHGSKVREERIEFKSAEGIAERKTAKGGASKMPIGACAHDALAFVYHLRNELKLGRIPSREAVYFGSAYTLTIKYAGNANVALASGAEAADKLEIQIQGPASKHAIEVYYGRDAQRTPLLFKVPLPLGSFTMELQR
jgi:hypothetical protein